VTKWIRSLRWSESHHAVPTASECDSHQWWIGIPLEQSDGSLLGVFCVSQSPGTPPTQPSRFAADLALRLKPLLDCIHRDLANAPPVRSQVQTLTQRSAELEWLFKVTSNLKAGVDDKRILEQLVAEATSRLSSAFGVLYVPDKRLTVKCENDKSASAPLLEAWSQPPAANYSHRQVFLARHIGRQAASIVEAQFDLMTGLYTRSGLDQMYSGLADAADFIESSVIYLDIDHMHVANELHGFELGNELIVRVADLLSTPLLPDDALAARVSADRFAIVLDADLHWMISARARIH
jgi:predicted signal transduction protein with EAL and GGDEF domain